MRYSICLLNIPSSVQYVCVLGFHLNTKWLIVIQLDLNNESKLLIFSLSRYLVDFTIQTRRTQWLSFLPCSNEWHPTGLISPWSIHPMSLFLLVPSKNVHTTRYFQNSHIFIDEVNPGHVYIGHISKLPIPVPNIPWMPESKKVLNYLKRSLSNCPNHIMHQCTGQVILFFYFFKVLEKLGFHLFFAAPQRPASPPSSLKPAVHG